jgi:predicted 3-demethylubiquinone-9 3-methyltransferase (glyoxalase superfamily)
MSKVTPFITYNNQAEEAVNFYVTLFKNSRVISMSRYPDAMPGMGGMVMSATFELDGREFLALNGGPHFTFTEGFSLFVNCETQAEVDELWARLTAGGGEPGQCGWLKDKFGLSWQIIPTALGQLLGDPDPKRAGQALQAMLKMSKLDIAELQRAADAA